MNTAPHVSDGTVYLSAIMDLYNNEVIAYQASQDNATDLVGFLLLYCLTLLFQTYPSGKIEMVSLFNTIYGLIMLLHIFWLAEELVRAVTGTEPILDDCAAF